MDTVSSSIFMTQALFELALISKAKIEELRIEVEEALVRGRHTTAV